MSSIERLEKDAGTHQIPVLITPEVQSGKIRRPLSNAWVSCRTVHICFLMGPKVFWFVFWKNG